jgi:hypothetical protein
MVVLMQENASRANVRPTQEISEMFKGPSTVADPPQYLHASIGSSGSQSTFLTPEEAVLREFNERYAVVRTSSTHILVRKGRWEFDLDTRQSFRTFYENAFFVGSSGRRLSKADFWLKHPMRKTYQGIVFDPEHPGDHEEHFNIFRGFSVEPRQGDIALYWDHVYDVICDGNAATYTYLRKWMACVVQKPRLLATAIVLRGLQGTGKNRFVEHFGAIFGPHFITVNSLGHVLGRFNNHLKYAFLIHANEAVWLGDRREVGALKAMITDPTILIEGKGKDAIQVDNCRHLIISSNEVCPVPLDLDDRRFLILDVSPSRKGDIAYFQRLEFEMAREGPAALLYDLLTEDIRCFDPRILPISDAALDVKLYQAQSTQRYLFESLREGRLNLVDRTGCWESLPCEIVYRHYRAWCEAEGLRAHSSIELGRVMQKLLQVPRVRRTVSGIRAWWYEFQPLQACRRRFEQFAKHSPQVWSEEGDQ